MHEFLVYYVTCANKAEAVKIANELVESGLVACANILPEMESIYKWQGDLQSNKETVLLLKGMAFNQQKVIAQVKAIHSYTTPCIITLPIVSGEHNYLQWIKGSLG